jgi:hypothetical protein
MGRGPHEIHGRELTDIGTQHIRTLFCTSSKACAISDLRLLWCLIRPIALLREFFESYWPKLISIFVFSLRSTNSKPTWVLPRPTSRRVTKSCRNVFAWLNSSAPTFLDPSITMNRSCFLCEHFLEPGEIDNNTKLRVAWHVNSMSEGHEVIILLL